MTAEIRQKQSESLTGPNNPNWTGGEWEAQGRVFVWVAPQERHLHPTIRRDGYIQRYHYVWNAAHPGDPVRPGQVVHHLNGNPKDDRLENLERLAGQSEHVRNHGLGHQVRSTP